MPSQWVMPYHNNVVPRSVLDYLLIIELTAWYGMVWYGILEFNVTLNTVWVISETGELTAVQIKRSM